jgi:hypothetical protein
MLKLGSRPRHGSGLRHGSRPRRRLEALPDTARRLNVFGDLSKLGNLPNPTSRF